ncbi:MAG: cohesin domain-containing protein [Candidatus Izemoplasmatales bacterium]|jgi:hypothetical protein|nr:cohesin domain-containing protein [Candidatus Izemoplasmatales bacterium]
MRRKNSIPLKLLMLLLMLLLSFLLVPQVHATEETQPAIISLSDITVPSGNSGVIYVRLNNVENLAGLSFNVYYDSSAFIFLNHIVETAIRNANVVVNFDEPGVIKVSIISLNPITHTGNILRFSFSSNPQASPGRYLFDLAVDEAYDILLEPLSLMKINGHITTLGQSQTTPTINFASPTQSQPFKKGEVVSLTISSFNLFQLTAGNFLIHYDPAYLEVKSVKLGSDFNKPQVLTSINYFPSGGIDISFASLAPLTTSQVLTVEFEVIANINKQTQIYFTPRNLYNTQLQTINHNEIQRSISLSYTHDVVQDYPNMYITDYQGDLNSTFSVDVRIDENSKLAAGDFHINYDNSKLEVIDVTIGDSINENGGYIFYNLNYSDNIISFSYINEHGLDNEELFMTLHFKSKQLSESTYLDLLLTGTSLVNDQFKPIQLNFVDGLIYLGEYKNIEFIDYDQTVLFETRIPRNEVGEIPFTPERSGTSFSHWNVVSLTDDKEIYQAVYRLESSDYDLPDYIITYDGKHHERMDDFNISGLTIEYTNNLHKNSGTYVVLASFYLDQVFQFQVSTRLIILPKEINVTLLDQSIVYGMTLNETYQVEGLIDDDDLELEFYTDLPITIGSQILKARNLNLNYAVNFTYSTLTVSPAPLLIKAINQTSVYGEAFSTLRYEIEGEIFNQDMIQVFIEKAPGVNSGHYEISVFAEHPNYDIQLVYGTYVIEKATYDMSGILFNDQEVMYSGNMTSLEIEGTLPLGVSVSYMNNENILLGEYNVTAFFTHNNPNYYSIPNLEATIKIIPANFESIEFNNKIIEYNGLYHSIEPMGMLETAEINYIGDYSFKDPGTYDISVVVSAYGYHDLTLSATLNIQRASLKISADNIESLYGETILDLSYTVQGSIYADDEIIINLIKEPGLSSGIYEIFITAEHPNYDIETYNGNYTIIGSEVDLSELSFEDVTYVYDGLEKTLIVSGSLPEGIIDIEYQNNKITDSGEIIAIAKIIVSDAYNPVEPMVARITIEKANIEGISLIGGHYTYDSTDKIFQLSSGLTQHGDTFEIINNHPLVYRYPGYYEVSIIIKNPNYHDLHLSASMTIDKGVLNISKNDFTFTITESRVTVFHPQYQNYIYTSLDGSNFIKTTTRTGLTEQNEYTLYFYISGVPYYEDTQIMNITFTTYLSIETFMFSVDSIINDLSAREEIINLMILKPLLSESNQAVAQIEINALIQAYNNLVEAINQEYNATEISMHHNSYYWTTLTLIGLVYIRRGQKK